MLKTSTVQVSVREVHLGGVCLMLEMLHSWVQHFFLTFQCLQ